MSEKENLELVSTLSEEELEEEMDKLVEKGYMEVKVEDGKKLYRVTSLGRAYAKALRDQESSKKENRN